MQFKLLNFYKIIAQFATCLVGGFIPIIIYQATGIFWYAILSITAEMILRTVLNIAFKRLIPKYPQILLLLRVVPFVLVSVFLFVIDYSFWIGVVGVVIFNALSYTFKNIPQEIVFNYSSGENSSGSIGVTRLFDGLGLIAGYVLGGLIIDYVSKVALLIISSAAYVIAVVPLVIYYVREKKQKGFNIEASTDAIEYFHRNKELNPKKMKACYKVLWRYFLVYFAFCFLDTFPLITNLFLFVKMSDMYFVAGIASALFWGLFDLGSVVYAKWEEKYDTTKLLIVSCIVAGAAVIIAPFAKNLYLFLYFVALAGLMYSVISVYALSNMLNKTRIIGESNNALTNRQYASDAAQGFVAPFCLISFPVGFIVIGVMLIACGYLLPANEEYCRHTIVDFLQDNDTPTGT